MKFAQINLLIFNLPKLFGFNDKIVSNIKLIKFSKAEGKINEIQKRSEEEGEKERLGLAQMHRQKSPL